MKAKRSWFLWILIAWLLVIVIGGAVDIWNSRSEDHQAQLRALHDRAERWRKRVHESDQQIRTLTVTIDSLQNIRNEIKIIHADRHVLPFPVADTGARTGFFQDRYPHLFTHIGD